MADPRFLPVVREWLSTLSDEQMEMTVGDALTDQQRQAPSDSPFSPIETAADQTSPQTTQTDLAASQDRYQNISVAEERAFSTSAYSQALKGAIVGAPAVEE